LTREWGNGNGEMWNGDGDGDRRAMSNGASCEATSQVHNFEMNMATKEF